MQKQKITEGRIVTFNPSDNALKAFKNKKKKSYPAIVTEVNEKTVDLTVFGVGETHPVNNIHHTLEVGEDESSWDWPTQV